MSRAITMLVCALCVVAGCRGGAGPASLSTDTTADATPPSTTNTAHVGPCTRYTTVDACLADVENACFWGPNYASPAGAPCEPAEGVCQSAYAPTYPVLDPTDDAACRLHTITEECLADTEHHCMMPPASLAPCTLDGGCPPPPECQTTPLPTCTSTLPIIGPALIGPSCGCATPVGGVCIETPNGTSSGCVERPPCDDTDICACLTGLGTCTPGRMPNLCVCDAV
jgi:hypothetical protein